MVGKLVKQVVRTCCRAFTIKCNSHILERLRLHIKALVMWQSLEGWWPQPGFGPRRQPAWSHEQTSTCQRLLHQVEREARSKLGFENIVLRNEKCQYWLPYKEIHSAPDHWSSNSKVVLQARMETVIREEKLSSKMDSTDISWWASWGIYKLLLTFSFFDQDWMYL